MQFADLFNGATTDLLKGHHYHVVFHTWEKGNQKKPYCINVSKSITGTDAKVTALETAVKKHGGKTEKGPCPVPTPECIEDKGVHMCRSVVEKHAATPTKTTPSSAIGTETWGGNSAVHFALKHNTDICVQI